MLLHRLVCRGFGHQPFGWQQRVGVAAELIRLSRMRMCMICTR